MTITSLGFILFIAVGAFIYYLLKDEQKWKFLLVMSILSVGMANFAGIFCIMLTAISIYYAALKIEKINKRGEDESSPKGLSAKTILVITIIFNLAILIALKYLSGYFDALMQNLVLPMTDDGSLLWQLKRLGFISGEQRVVDLLIPLGISYYTLMAISYVVDVYWERVSAEKSFAKTLLFVCYFPQMAQGPISKFGQLNAEFMRPHPLNAKNIKFGFQLMLWGYFKKLLIADRVAVHFLKPTLAAAQTDTGEIGIYGFTCVAAFVYWGIELYCDFSGGIDIIRGASEVFDIHMIENFRQPYFSKSLGEFWRRWHISLGAWMKDYIFFPLSMSRPMTALKKKLKKPLGRRTANNITIAIGNLVVFTIVGVWHGMGTNFLGWGLYNAVILAFSALMIDVYAKMKKGLHINEQSVAWKGFCLVRTLIIVTIGWAYDLGTTMTECNQYIINMFSVSKTDFGLILKPFRGMEPLFVIMCLGILFIVSVLNENGKSVREIMDKRSFIVQLIFWTFVIQLVGYFAFTTKGGFIYANY